MHARPVITLLMLVGISLGISAIVALIAPTPEPQFHDEFSYLLAGDTFAHGRLTNPPHPLWKFFETFHVIQRPTYMSKYPPGQGLMLALGQVVGHPILGVWISTALACVAIWFGLVEFVPKRWATIGALLVAMHPLMLTWNHGYWGGAVAVTGGALIVGGVARFARRGDWIAGLKFAIGAFVLAISRPYEGFVLTLLSVVSLLIKRFEFTKHRSGAIAAASILVAMGAAWIGYYNWRVTGNALRVPYVEYESQYAIAPPVVWLPRSGTIPEYRHEAMRDYYVKWWLPMYQRQRTVRGFIESLGEKSWKFAAGYFGAIGLVIPLIIAPFVIRRDRVLCLAVIIALLFTLIVFANLGFFPHYSSPAVVVYMLMVVQGLRHWRAGYRPRMGRWITRAVVAAQVIGMCIWMLRLDHTRDDWHFRRADLIAERLQMGGKHLILVHHEPGAIVHTDWVFNDADIDGSRVVWARDMGDEANRALLDYFRDRRVWKMTVGERATRIELSPLTDVSPRFSRGAHAARHIATTAPRGRGG